MLVFSGCFVLPLGCVVGLLLVGCLGLLEFVVLLYFVG